MLPTSILKFLSNYGLAAILSISVSIALLFIFITGWMTVIALSILRYMVPLMSLGSVIRVPSALLSMEQNSGFISEEN
jgi:hypothetical protein